MSMVECLIKRDGPTEVVAGGFKYIFEKNAAGHSVCDVVNDGVRKFLFEFGGGTMYREYKPGEDYKDAQGDANQPASKTDRDAEIFTLSVKGVDATEIAQRFKLSRARVLAIIKEQADVGQQTT